MIQESFSLVVWLALPSLVSASDLPPFALENFDGKPIGNATLVGKTTIVVPTFAKCVFACPMVTFLLTELDEDLGAPPGIQYLLVSVQPKDDTAEEIRSHFRKHAIDPETDPRWLFANGPEDEIEKLLAETGIEVSRTAVTEGVLVEHTIKVYVVGSDRRTVASFDTYLWDEKEMSNALRSSLSRNR